MNQILYINSEKQKGGPLDLKVILRFFAVVIIIFGIILIGKASFALIEKNEEVSTSIPAVVITQQGKVLKLVVTHDKPIDKITYMWNSQKPETELQGMGRTNIEEDIELPLGINILNLNVIDVNGKSTSYNKQYVLENEDVTAPEIEIEQEDPKIKIIAKDETAIDYIEYYWNEEDKTRIDATSLSSKQIEEKIQAIKGINTLHVIAVDKAGNRNEKEKPCKAVTKPKINLSVEENMAIIKISDEEGIKKLEYEINGALYSTDPENTGVTMGMKEFEYKQELASGQNKLVVKVYNMSGLMTEATIEPSI